MRGMGFDTVINRRIDSRESCKSLEFRAGEEFGLEAWLAVWSGERGNRNDFRKAEEIGAGFEGNFGVGELGGDAFKGAGGMRRCAVVIPFLSLIHIFAEQDRDRPRRNDVRDSDHSRRGE